MMSDDMALVQEYAEGNSERAFAELVSRHVNLVYSVAMRQVRDVHLAEEITQTVFIILARKAKALSPKTILSGWLCRTARNVCADTLKSQRRRQFREQEAQMRSLLNQPDTEAWRRIAPLLDEALNCLGVQEHDAVVLRFFDGKEFKQVAAAMGTTEDAARMRVNRGVEKLRDYFTRKGVTVSVAALTGAVAAHSVQAAPPALVGVLTKAAMAAAATPGTTSIAAGVFTFQKAIIGALLIFLLWVAGSAIFSWPPLYHYAGGPLYPCVEGLAHIEAGKRRWAVETGQTNGAPVDPAQFEHYLRTKLGLSPEYPIPHCPSGGTYTYGEVDQLPTCSLGGKPAPSPVQQRVGLFGWRWKVAPSTPESHILTPAYVREHLGPPGAR